MSPAVPHDQQAIEQTKRDCGHDEQIHRRDAVGMIMKERLPPLRWRASSPGHILGHARLSDIDAELEQFPMDPRRAPHSGLAMLISRISRRISGGHNWPAATAPRLPAPIRPKTRTMPADNGVRLNDRQSIANSREQPIETNEYQLVDGTEGEFP